MNECEHHPQTPLREAPLISWLGLLSEMTKIIAIPVVCWCLLSIFTQCAPSLPSLGIVGGGIFVEGFNMGISSTSGGRPGSNDVSSWDSPKLIEHSGTLKLRGKEISSRTSWQKTLSMSCALTVISLSGPLCHQHPAKCPYRGYRGSRKKMEKLFRDVYSTMFPPNFPAQLYGSMLLESY